MTSLERVLYLAPTYPVRFLDLTTGRHNPNLGGGQILLARYLYTPSGPEINLVPSFLYCLSLKRD